MVPPFSSRRAALTSELSRSLTPVSLTAQSITLQSVLLDPSPPNTLLLSLLPDFSLSLSESPSIHLSAQYRSFSAPLPTLAIHATVLSQADQASLNEELGRLSGSAEVEGEGKILSRRASAESCS